MSSQEWPYFQILLRFSSNPSNVANISFRKEPEIDLESNGCKVGLGILNFCAMIR